MLADWLLEARILIVDDEPANVDLLERLLSMAGYTNVVSSSDSRNTLSLVESFQPDLILLDWMMPHMDGLAVLQQLQGYIPAQTYLPILVLTADITRESRRQALSSGSKDFLTKPLDVTETMLRIRNLLETRYLHIELKRHITSLTTEIAERQRAEAALRISEEKFGAIFRGALDVVVLIDSDDGCIVDINPAAAMVLGYAEDQLRGQPFAILLAPDTEQPFAHADQVRGNAGQASVREVASTSISAELIAQTRAHGRVVDTHEFRRADGSRCPIELTAAMIQWHQHQYVLVTLRDITERRRAEAETRNALARQSELSELKMRFVSLASHEFRTPLSTILSSAELIEQYGQKWSEEKRLSHLDRIKRAVKQMAHLLEDVLLIGRIDAGRLPFQPAPLDLVALCTELVDECRQKTGGQHQITLTCHGDCSATSIDARLVQQILTNLLSNAIKYSPNAGPVALELSCAGQHIIFQLADRGIGIPPEACSQLFEAFHRADNVEHIAGFGLGLSIVKRAVELHGGTIEYQSQLHAGTTFTVILPLARNGD